MYTTLLSEEYLEINIALANANSLLRTIATKIDNGCSLRLLELQVQRVQRQCEKACDLLQTLPKERYAPNP